MESTASQHPIGDGDGDALARIADAFADPGEVRAARRGYLRFFADGRSAGGQARRVLDVGCGSGVFLDLLREAGFAAVGVDASEAAATACRARGHEVVCGEAGAVVERLAQDGERFDGVMLAHVVEHLEPGRALSLMRGVVGVLAPGGRLVVVTPNPRNLIVVQELFWLDPTHVRPYPRALIERLGREAGLATVASFDDEATVPRRGALRRWLARLRSALSGADRSAPLDSVVVLGGP